MKLKLYSFLFIASLSFLAFSCKTASKLYEKGNYDEAVELAAKKLQKEPGDAQLLNIIQNAYRYAVADHESSIRSNSTSTNELKWEWIYKDYSVLQSMYDAIRKVPSVSEIIHPVDYSEYLVTYGVKAGDTRYERGLALMPQDDAQHPANKQNYRNAYHEFQAALGFKPGDRDVLQKMDEAYDYAVTNVVILPIETYTGYQYSSYNSGYQGFDEKLLRTLQLNSGNEFVKYYSSGDAASRDIRADEVVDMRLSTINIGRYFDSRSTKRVSKEVVIKETVIRPDSIVKEYGTVYADITNTKRWMNSDALLQVNIRDGNGVGLWSDNINGNNSWNTEFASFTGDQRALNEADKQLINRRQEQPPGEDEIMRCLMDEISNHALNRIQNHFIGL